MSDFTKLNLKDDVENVSAQRGMTEMEAHFGRGPLGIEQQGLSYFRIDPGFRPPFGHTHGEQEEVYVVISGSARFKIGEEIVEAGRLDAVRVAPGTWRAFEAGPEGVELIAVGAPNTENKDGELEMGWWTD